MTRSASSLTGRPVLLGLDDQLVVDVGDVDDPGDLVAEVDEVALDRVEDDRPDHVADVALRVDRRPADVHAHLAGGDGLERLLGLAQRVIDSQAAWASLEVRWACGPRSGIALATSSDRARRSAWLGPSEVSALDQDDGLAGDGLAAADRARRARRSWP